MLLSYSYCLESREGISNILRIHWSTTSNNITSWDLLGNKVSDKSAWWEALRSQIAVSNLTFRKNARGKAESLAKTDRDNKPRDRMLFMSPQGVQNCCFYTKIFFSNNNCSQFTLILTDQYHIHMNSTQHLHFTTVWKEWWERRGSASGIICENISLTGMVGNVTLQKSPYLKSV